MYILLGVIVFIVVAVFVRYGSMDYYQKNWKECGCPNTDIREAQKKR